MKVLLLPLQGMIACFLILYLMGQRPWLGATDIAQYWVLLIPAICAFGMYALVYVDLRYLGPFVVLAWAGVFCGLTLRDCKESRRLMVTATMTSVLVVLVSILTLTFPGINFLREIKNLGETSTHVNWQVAVSLKLMGVQPRDKVAFIGRSYDAHWARLAGVPIIVEITGFDSRYPSEDADDFWTADNGVKLRVLNTMASVGANVVIARKVPGYGSMVGWQKIGSTDHYIYFLKERKSKRQRSLSTGAP